MNQWNLDTIYNIESSNFPIKKEMGTRRDGTTILSVNWKEEYIRMILTINSLFKSAQDGNEWCLTTPKDEIVVIDRDTNCAEYIIE